MTEKINLEVTAKDGASSVLAKVQENLEKTAEKYEDLGKSQDSAAGSAQGVGGAIGGLKGKLAGAAVAVAGAVAGYLALENIMGKISETVTKANEAWGEEVKKRGKSASSLGSIAQANEKLGKAQNGVYAAIGKIIDRSSVYQSTINGVSKIFDKLTKFIEDNEDAIIKLVTEGFDKAVTTLQEVATWVEENSEKIARFTTLVDAAWPVVDILTGYLGTVANIWKLKLSIAVAAATIAIGGFLKALAAVIKFTTGEVPEGLDETIKFFDEFEKGAIDSARNAGEGIVKNVKKTFNGTVEAYKVFENAINGPEGLFKGMSESIKAAANEILKQLGIIKEEQKKGTGGDGKTTGGSSNRAEIARQKEVLELQHQILLAQQEGDRVKEANLTKDLAILEANHSVVGIKDKGLRAQMLTVAGLEAELAHAEALKGIREEEVADRREAAALEMQMQREVQASQDQIAAREAAQRASAHADRIAQIEERWTREVELIQNAGEIIEGAFGGVGGMIDGISEKTQKMLDGFAKSANQATALTKAFKAYNKEGATTAEQQDAINAAVAAGAGVLSGVTSSFIENKRAQAGIEALINAAAAAASYAQGNIAAGIAYTSAAVTYGAAATFGGGGGGGGSNIPASIGSSGGSGYMNSPEEERRLSAEAFASAFEDRNASTGGIVINVDMGSSVHLSDSPKIAQEIANAIEPELRGRGF